MTEEGTEPTIRRVRSLDLGIRAAHSDGDACCGGPDPARVPASPSDAETDSEGDEVEPPRPPLWRDRALLPSAISGLALLAGAVLGGVGAEVAGIVLESIALLAGASTFVPGAIRRLLKGRLGVGLLMTIAAVGAVALGRIGEAAALAFLFSLAEALEDRAMDRAREGLRALLSLIPDTARVSRLAGDEVVPVRSLRELDILIVGAGERVATDGVVVEGRSSVDASAVTGESIPVEVGPGDPVPAGAVNGSGTLRIEATADGRDNSLTQIVALVEQANSRKGERARLADRIARPLVPAVMIIAAGVAAFGFVVGDPGTWIVRALVVLVAASPCALAIAVPVTVISAIGSASRSGVVIKSGAAFEAFGTIRRIALDKTGTLTRNRPELVAVRTVPGVRDEEAVALAAALESSSTHPLARAIVAAAPAAPSAADLVELAGRGVSATVDGAPLRVGSPRWVAPGELAGAVDEFASQGMSLVVVERDGRPIAVLGVRDEPRPEAAETIRMLADQGVDVAMITGDDDRTGRTIARQIGIAEVYSQQSPADKAATVERLQRERPTAMVGDGINDAPALATATVGIAMGATGSAVAVESAEIAFTGSDLRLIPVALAHARRGRRIMTVNIGLSLAIIVGLFPLALFGVLGLAQVVLVHEIAEVIVILNGVRIARRPRTATRILRTAPATAVGPVPGAQREDAPR
ncbi:MAG: cadmium-translocating P-type ATPase [Micrococcales bacterium]|nr:cadmium-translocating P-type ATPase [Micrococcales bacterium]